MQRHISAPRLRRWLVGGLVALAACESPELPVTPGPDENEPVPTALWSDPASWPDGQVPTAGSVVTVPEGRSLLLDVSPPELAGLEIRGDLVFDRTDLELRSRWILVRGSLRVGTQAEPFTQEAIITLVGPEDETNIQGVGTKVLAVMAGGSLDLHGVTHDAWVRLARTADPGATTIELERATDWSPGHRVALAPTGFDSRQAETRVITAASGATITLDDPLTHQHYGQIQTIEGTEVDERAEVGLLTRNLVVRGDSLSTGGFGGHMVVLVGAEARIQGVELHRMGQEGRMARYPMHWHLADDVSGQFFTNNSVWESGNRCVTVHGTDNALVRDNVCYDHVGHGFFLEDGAESGNVIEGNLGMRGRKGTLLPSDDTPATYWITNPDNTLVGNVAAGSEGHGFWYALPESPLGPSAGAPDLPQYTPLGEFRANVAHSNHRNGLHVDDGPEANGETDSSPYKPRSNPADPASDPVVANFDDLVAYKNRVRGVWLRGHEHRLRNAILADNRTGATFASTESFLEDGLMVAETANNHDTRSYYRGFEFYDGRVGIRRTSFVGFNQTGGEIPSSALGYLRQNRFTVDPRNDGSELSFVDSRRVYLEDPAADRDGDKSAVFQDTDGSVTGSAGIAVAANSPFLLDPTCTYQPDWNAHTCGGRYVSLRLRADVALPVLTLNRDDGAEVELYGANQPEKRSVSVRTDRTYQVDFPGVPPVPFVVEVRDAEEGDEVVIAVPWTNATPRVVRDYNGSSPLQSVASLTQLLSSDGSVYFHDGVSGMIHLKARVRQDRNYSRLAIEN